VEAPVVYVFAAAVMPTDDAQNSAQSPKGSQSHAQPRKLTPLHQQFLPLPNKQTDF